MLHSKSTSAVKATALWALILLACIRFDMVGNIFGIISAGFCFYRNFVIAKRNNFGL